jgi:hypothetical protein
MLTLITKVFLDTLQITLFVTIMMIIVDFLHSISKGKIKDLIQGKAGFRQYIISSVIGVIPGCFGGFTNVSLYIHKVISFGALAGSMIAVSGDEAFVMLALFPKHALILFLILFFIGVFSGKIIDLVILKRKITTCDGCKEQVIHDTKLVPKHFLTVHIFHHIIKKHIWKTALWTFGALFIIEIGIEHLNLAAITSEYKIGILFLSAVIGMIPESGSHMLFVTMFSTGLIPFSVLLTSSIVQDGHGMLPMLSYSVKDFIKIKIFNIIIGLFAGIILFSFGY